MSWLSKREKLDPKQASAIDFAVAQEGNYSVSGEVGMGKPSETLIDAVQRKVLVALKGGDVMSTSELAEKVGISQPKNMRRRYLRLLLDMGLVEYTIPQKPNSRLQKYRLTDKGRSALAASVH